MELLFKQKIFSWFDSYDVYDAGGAVQFTVKGKLAWGHCLEIYDANDTHVGTVKEEIFTFLPRFQLFINDENIGEICKEFTFFKPVFTLNCNDWQVCGDIFEWDYNVQDSDGSVIMHAEKQLFNFSDTYTINVADPKNTLLSLMIVLAIDAAKCHNN